MLQCLVIGHIIGELAIGGGREREGRREGGREWREGVEGGSGGREGVEGGNGGREGVEGRREGGERVGRKQSHYGHHNKGCIIIRLSNLIGH